MIWIRSGRYFPEIDLLRALRRTPNRQRASTSPSRAQSSARKGSRRAHERRSSVEQFLQVARNSQKLCHSMVGLDPPGVSRIEIHGCDVRNERLRVTKPRSATSERSFRTVCVILNDLLYLFGMSVEGQVEPFPSLYRTSAKSRKTVIIKRCQAYI